MRSRPGGTRRRRAIIAIASAVLLIGAGLTSPAEPAEAFTYYVAKKPGKIFVTDQIQGTHYRLCAGGYTFGGVYYPNCVWSPAILAPPVRIGRSAASKSAQRVTLTWYIQRIDNGSWYTHTQGSLAYTIAKGTSSITSHSWFRIPTKAYSMRTVMKVTWTLASTGKSLGSYRAVMNHAADYRCATQFPCQVYSNSIWLKAPGV